MFNRLTIFALTALIATNFAQAQERQPAQEIREADQPAPSVLPEEENPLADGDDRNGMWVPKTVEELRVISQEWWQQFRRTNQRQYKYIGEAAQFRAYLQVCKRNDLNVNMESINTLSNRHMQQILLAIFKEAEYAIIETLDKEQQAALMADLASDAYGFEFGYRIAHQRAIINVSGGTTNNYCAQVEKDNFDKYIALRATAKREIE